MKKAKIYSILFAILMCISHAFAVKYMDVELRIADDGEKLIGLLIREGKTRKYFWSVALKGKPCNKGRLPKQVMTFLYEIHGLSIPETSPMYNSMIKACKEYDKERDSYPLYDFENETIYLFNYSPDNKHFKTIINNLRRLSKCYFDLNLLKDCIIR